MTVAWPGTPIVIVPAQVHWQVGAGTGMQGCGVRTPMAADVAAATGGFAGETHIPNVGMLAIGIVSAMVATC